MGYYHVNGSGKGIILQNFDKVNKDYKLPPLDYLRKYFDKPYYRDEINFEWLSEMDIYHQLAYLSLNSFQRSLLMNRLPEKTSKAFCEMYDELYSDEFDSEVPDLFECLFCYRYGYPFDCFKGVSDYDGNIMFYCCVQYPLEEYNKNFAELTEDVFIKQLREFFADLLDDEYYKTVELSLCEEYIKE